MMDFKALTTVQLDMFTLLHSLVPECYSSRVSKDLVLISFEVRAWDIIFKYYQGNRTTVKTLTYNYFNDSMRYDKKK